MYKFGAVLGMLALSACMGPPTANGFRDMSVSVERSSTVPSGPLPYGEISQACGVSRSALGRKITQFPENSGKYQIYDTKPGSSGLRTFYVTGFSDGCARQFSASLAVFGSIKTYENIRYSPAGKTIPFSTTDQAYEKLKGQLCKVPAGKPCGANLNKISENTVFLTVYKNFGANKGWTDVLIHGGKVIAFDHKRG